jgi:hypothetical protein
MKTFQKTRITFSIVLGLSIFILPHQAHADCDISLSGSVSPTLQQISVDPAAKPQDVTITVNWNASSDCFDYITVNIDGELYEKMPRSGSKTITRSSRKFSSGDWNDSFGFAGQLEIECLPPEDQRSFSLAGQLTRANASVIGCTTNGKMTYADGKEGPAVLGIIRPDVAQRVIGTIGFGVGDGGGTVKTGYVKTCALFVGHDTSLCTKTDGKQPGYTYISETERPFGKDAFRGSNHLINMTPEYPSDSDIKKDRAQVILDPDFVQATKKANNFVPNIKDLNPLDTIRLRIPIRSPRTDTMPYLRVDLMATNASGTEITLTGHGTGGTRLHTLWKNNEWLAYPREYTPEIDQWFLARPAEYVFETDPISLANSAVVESINKNLPVFLRISRSDSPKTPESDLVKTDIPLQMSLCAQTYGDGPEHIVVRKGTSAQMSLGSFISHGYFYRTASIEPTEPYKSNSKVFSYFLDLGEYNDDILSLMLRNHHLPEDEHINDIETGTSCRDGMIYSLIMDLSKYRPSGTDETSTALNSGIAGLSNLNGDFLIDQRNYSADTFVHESGHAFGSLMDEEAGDNKIINYTIPFTNCSKNPEEDFTFNGARYYDRTTNPTTGETEARAQGCAHVLGLTEDQILYKPSDKSLMNYSPHSTNEFNVVSCGWILHAINGQDAKAQFEKCSKLIQN